MGQAGWEEASQNALQVSSQGSTTHQKKAARTEAGGRVWSHQNLQAARTGISLELPSTCTSASRTGRGGFPLVLSHRGGGKELQQTQKTNMVASMETGTLALMVPGRHRGQENAGWVLGQVPSCVPMVGHPGPTPGLRFGLQSPANSAQRRLKSTKIQMPV